MKDLTSPQDEKTSETLCSGHLIRLWVPRLRGQMGPTRPCLRAQFAQTKYADKCVKVKKKKVRVCGWSEVCARIGAHFLPESELTRLFEENQNRATESHK